MLKSSPTPSFLARNRTKRQHLQLARSFQELEFQLALASSKARLARGEQQEKLVFNRVKRAVAVCQGWVSQMLAKKCPVKSSSEARIRCQATLVVEENFNHKVKEGHII